MMSCITWIHVYVFDFNTYHQLCVCPLPMRFFLSGWTGAELASSVDWCGSCLALALSPKNGEVF